MQRKQKPARDIAQEERLEAEDTVHEQSALPASPEEETTLNVLERILSRENMIAAYKRVRSNKGAPGVDGMTVDALRTYLNDHWAFVKAEILDGTYCPQPVRRVRIPKVDGTQRELGIPTVLDRLIQQAIAQILSALYNPQFSDSSHGYRPGRSTWGAVKQALSHVNEGKETVVEVDIEKFFDHVNHDILMGLLAKRLQDKRVLRLIRKYLKAGVMAEGVCVRNEDGTPQGGPLSPLLSNILLDVLDKELEKRGLSFCRYADDLCIFVRSQRAGERVLQGVSRYLERKLKLRLNARKSQVVGPSAVKLLGFSFYLSKGEHRIRIHSDSVRRIKGRVREITRSSRSQSLQERLEKLKQVMRGWGNAFQLAEGRSVYQKLDEYVRTRLRVNMWRQWKKPRTRVSNLRSLGLSERAARKYGNSSKGPYRTAQSLTLKLTLTNRWFREQGYFELRSLHLR